MQLIFTELTDGVGRALQPASCSLSLCLTGFSLLLYYFFSPSLFISFTLFPHDVLQQDK